MRFLLCFFILLIVPSCIGPGSYSKTINNPPYENFVKIFKEMELTKCRKSKKEKLDCVLEVYYSTGSGMVVDLNLGNEVIILSAGHVCSSSYDLKKEDSNYIYYWKERIKVLDYKKTFHDAGIILSEHASRKTGSSDLCSLMIPSLDKTHFPRRVKISKTPPKIGEQVYYIGAPLGIYHPPTALISTGIFSGKIDDISSLTSLLASQGASGSAVMSMNGKIYGVLFAVHGNFKGATIITDYKKTKKFLMRTKKTIEILRLK